MVLVVDVLVVDVVVVDVVVLDVVVLDVVVVGATVVVVCIEPTPLKLNSYCSFQPLPLRHTSG